MRQHVPFHLPEGLSGVTEPSCCAGLARGRYDEPQRASLGGLLQIPRAENCVQDLAFPLKANGWKAVERRPGRIVCFY